MEQDGKRVFSWCDGSSDELVLIQASAPQMV